jgi:hypothetical protein
MCVSMFTVCIGYVSYGELLWIALHSVIEVIGDSGHPALTPL